MGVSHDLSRGDILLFWAFGAVALLFHRMCGGRFFLERSKAARCAAAKS